MNSSSLQPLLRWGGATLLIIILLILVRLRRYFKAKQTAQSGKPQSGQASTPQQSLLPLLTLKELFTVGLAVAGILSGGQIIYQTFTNQQLQQLLGGLEGEIALIYGGIASLWLAGKEVLKLIFPALIKDE